MIAIEVDTKGLEGWVAELLRQPLADMEAVIFNLVPYVLPLEFGHSRQAPAGMIRVSLREIAQKLGQNVAAVPMDAVAHNGQLQQRVEGALDDTAEYGRLLIRGRTPIDTGRARRGWEVLRAADRGTARIFAAVDKQLKEHAAQKRVREIVKHIRPRFRGGYFAKGGPTGGPRPG